jgi:hypothetical protein
MHRLQAEGFVTELSATFADFDQLITRAGRSLAALRVLAAHSRALIAQSARLCGMARPILGGSDLDSPLIADLIARVPMCLPCVAKKTGMAETRAAEAMERIGTYMVVQNTTASCEGCLRTTTTYRIPDRTPQADGGPAQPQARQAALSQNGALWKFLESHRGKMFCTQCIATALFATKRIDRAVLGAEGRGARRQYGTCTSCGKERLLCGLTS